MTKAPPLKNDCFALPPGVHWTPVDDALELLRGRLHPVVTQETVDLDAAAGRILAQDIAALRDHPPLPNTAVDGYGFDGGLDAGEHALPLVQGRAAAGLRFNGAVPKGAAIRILTGAALPKGVTTVVLQEDVVVDGDTVHLRGPVKAGANTRKAGEDMLAGQTILTAGRKLTPADVGMLATVGLHDVPVFTPLRVAILSTGDELLHPGQTAQPGQIFDANRPMLSAMVRAWGYDVVDMGIQPDDPASIRAALDQAALTADVILTSGGASAGDEDHMSAVLNETGSMALWRIAIKPGRPLALGVWNGAPVFGLPGNPVAAFVCTAIFARPAMALLSGQGFETGQGIMVPAGFAKRKKAGRREYLRARLVDGCAQVFASEGSGRISGLSWADGLVELPDGALDITPGTPVRYLPFSALGL